MDRLNLLGRGKSIARNLTITHSPIPFPSPAKIPKLYYTPSSCGAASFIAAHSAGLQMACEEVDLSSHRTASGEDFHKVNPKGNVPTIVFEHGACKVILNENLATLQYIADQVPSSHLSPPSGSIERYELLNHLSFIASEVHPAFANVLHTSPSKQQEFYDHYIQNLRKKLLYLEQSLLYNKTLVMGKHFTIADAYLFVILSWHKTANVNLPEYKNIWSYYERVKEMQNIKEAYERMHKRPSCIY